MATEIKKANGPAFVWLLVLNAGHEVTSTDKRHKNYTKLQVALSI